MNVRDLFDDDDLFDALSANQRRAGQMGPDFRPQSIRVLGTPTDPANSNAGKLVGEDHAMPTMDKAKMAYMTVVVEAPLGTPSSDFIRWWQHELSKVNINVSDAQLQKLMREFNGRTQQIHAELTKKYGDYEGMLSYINEADTDVAEGYAGVDDTDTVGFSVNSEAAYMAVMKRFGDVIDHDETSGIMYAPARVWPQIEMTAFDADPDDGAIRTDDDMMEGLRDPKDNPCWKGYKPVGTKKKGGRTVPNCVPKESVEEGRLDEASARDVIFSLLDKFYADMKLPPRQGGYSGELDIESPGTQVWTRGDGTRYRKPGRIKAAYFPDDKKQAEKAAADFWPWLSKQPGVKSIGQVSGEFGSDPMKDAVSYKGLYFSGRPGGVEFGSLSRYKNPRSVWRQKKDEQGVAEGQDQDSPVANAILQRIMMRHQDLLRQYGPEAIMSAADEIAGMVGEVDEIGTSDVSGWVQQVGQVLTSQDMVEGKKHISPSGVETNMNPDDDDYAINYGKKGGVAKFRRSQGLDVKTGKKKDEQDVEEAVAGPEKCWKGYRKVGTKPGTGKNAGKRVNDCEKIKESVAVNPPKFPDDMPEDEKRAAWNKWLRTQTKKSVDAQRDIQDLANQLRKRKEQSVQESESEMDSPEFQEKLANLKKKAALGPMKTVFNPVTGKYRNVPVDRKQSSDVKESVETTYEEVLDKLKARLGDYLKDVADAVADDGEIVNDGSRGDQVDTVKTVVTDDGHEIRIHGNEDDGFRITIKNQQANAEFANLEEAEMAAEMYCKRRRQTVRNSSDYVSEGTKR